MYLFTFQEHLFFVKVDCVLISIYQLITAGYLFLLYSNRKRINPIEEADGNVEEALALRDSDSTISHLKILFSDIRCEAYVQ